MAAKTPPSSSGSLPRQIGSAWYCRPCWNSRVRSTGVVVRAAHVEDWLPLREFNNLDPFGHSLGELQLRNNEMQLVNQETGGGLGRVRGTVHIVVLQI